MSHKCSVSSWENKTNEIIIWPTLEKNHVCSRLSGWKQNRTKGSNQRALTVHSHTTAWAALGTYPATPQQIVVSAGISREFSVTVTFQCKTKTWAFENRSGYNPEVHWPEPWLFGKSSDWSMGGDMGGGALKVTDECDSHPIVPVSSLTERLDTNSQSFFAAALLVGTSQPMRDEGKAVAPDFTSSRNTPSDVGLNSSLWSLNALGRVEDQTNKKTKRQMERPRKILDKACVLYGAETFPGEQGGL